MRNSQCLCAVPSFFASLFANQNLIKQVGKKPIVVLDAPGSVINAILAYYYVESLYILEEGLALPSEIDELAKNQYSEDGVENFVNKDYSGGSSGGGCGGGSGGSCGGGY